MLLEKFPPQKISANTVVNSGAKTMMMGRYRYTLALTDILHLDLKDLDQLLV